jgi:hypothetical protein
VCFLWHCPSSHPDWPLASNLPCGARTFLPRRPEGRRQRSLTPLGPRTPLATPNARAAASPASLLSSPRPKGGRERPLWRRGCHSWSSPPEMRWVVRLRPFGLLCAVLAAAACRKLPPPEAAPALSVAEQLILDKLESLALPGETVTGVVFVPYVEGSPAYAKASLKPAEIKLSRKLAVYWDGTVLDIPAAESRFAHEHQEAWGRLDRAAATEVHERGATTELPFAVWLVNDLDPSARAGVRAELEDVGGSVRALLDGQVLGVELTGEAMIRFSRRREISAVLLDERRPVRLAVDPEVTAAGLRP